MNLFERLKDEHKDNLETGNVKHPSLVGYANRYAFWLGNRLEIFIRH